MSNTEIFHGKLTKVHNRLYSTTPSEWGLEPVCCKKRQTIVPDQLLVRGVGCEIVNFKLFNSIPFRPKVTVHKHQFSPS